MHLRTRRWWVVLASTVVLSAARSASADVTVSGAVLPNDPSDPWVLESQLEVGTVFGPISSDYSYTGEVLVTNRGTLVTNAGAEVGSGNEPWSDRYGTLSVIGYGSQWINQGAIKIGAHVYTFGKVIVRDGAKVVTDDIIVGSGGTFSCGELFVEGYDATLKSEGDAIIGNTDCGSTADIRQGASFFSNNAYIGSASDGSGRVRVSGYGTRWDATGAFIVGRAGRGEVEIGYQARLSTVNAHIADGDAPSAQRAGKVSVSGFGATWTNQGLLRVGGPSNGRDYPGYGKLTVGTYGTVTTEDTELRSELGGAVIQVAGFQASWHNSGDATLHATTPESPSLIIDDGGLARIGGTLAIQRWYIYSDEWLYPYPIAHLVNGWLIAGAIEDLDGDFAFAGGRLNIGSFLGDLANTQAGVLVVGGEHPSTSIVGDYTQGPSAKLNLTAAGPSATPLLQVEGNLYLAGRLEARAAEGTAPFQAGDTVTLLGWSGSLTGSFASVNIALPLAPGLAWDTSALYTTGEIHAVPATP